MVDGAWNRMWQPALNRKWIKRWKEESKRKKHTLKQREIPLMQIWAGQLLLTSDDEWPAVAAVVPWLCCDDSDNRGIRPFVWLTIGAWSSDLTLGGPKKRNAPKSYSFRHELCSIDNSIEKYWFKGKLQRNRKHELITTRHEWMTRFHNRTILSGI